MVHFSCSADLFLRQDLCSLPPWVPADQRYPPLHSLGPCVLVL